MKYVQCIIKIQQKKTRNKIRKTKPKIRHQKMNQIIRQTKKTIQKMKPQIKRMKHQKITQVIKILQIQQTQVKKIKMMINY